MKARILKEIMVLTKNHYDNDNGFIKGFILIPNIAGTFFFKITIVAPIYIISNYFCFKIPLELYRYRSYKYNMWDPILRISSRFYFNFTFKIFDEIVW